MDSIVKIQHNGQVTIRTRLRSRAGLAEGDLVEATLQQGKIVLTPKSPSRSLLRNADDTHTPFQRMAINRGVAQSQKEYKQGRSFGPFDTHQEYIASLHREAEKIRARKKKRAAH